MRKPRTGNRSHATKRGAKATRSNKAARPKSSAKKAATKNPKSKPKSSRGSSLSTLNKRIRKLEATLKRERKKLEEKRGIISPSAKQIREGFAANKAKALDTRRQKRATKAAKAYKVKAKDKGTYVFIGVEGGSNPQAKGKNRKGYLLYVDKKGKKRLVRQPKYGYRATKFTEAQAPLQKTKLASAKRFQDKKRITKKGEGEKWKSKKFQQHSTKNKTDAGFIRQSGSMKTGGAHDFNTKAIAKLSKSISKAIHGQESHRIFIIRTMVLVELPDGSEKVFDFNVDIAKADHLIIRLTGIEEFVRRRFYAYMARELSFLGFVSSGSANHIRSLKENKNKPKSKWKDSRGEPWTGRNKEIANIQALEWKIEQA